MKFKRYMLFGGSCIYPSGGMGDYIKDFDDLESLKSYGEKLDEEWVHVWDVESGKIILEGGSTYFSCCIQWDNNDMFEEY